MCRLRAAHLQHRPHRFLRRLQEIYERLLVLRPGVRAVDGSESLEKPAESAYARSTSAGGACRVRRTSSSRESRDARLPVTPDWRFTGLPAADWCLTPRPDCASPTGFSNRAVCVSRESAAWPSLDGEVSPTPGRTAPGLPRSPTTEPKGWRSQGRRQYLEGRSREKNA